MTISRCLVLCVLGAGLGIAQRAILAAEFPSHPPARPLPVAVQRPLGTGPAYFISLQGNDAHEGSRDRPWRTLQHAVTRLQPGDTLYLRGGVYHQHLTAQLAGRPQQPITICSTPGELVILDGGLAEFLNEPATAWEPCPDGVPGEFWSTQTYADLAPKQGDHLVTLLGNFADSMTPLQGYWNRGDLQSDNPYFNLNQSENAGGKVGANSHVYCGPGVWYDPATGRIHCRLAPTQLSGLGENNYRGETDPRRVPLVLAPWSSGPVLELRNSAHVVLQDLVLRGARQPTLSLTGGHHLELDGLTIYGGQACVKADGVVGLKMSHTACRGLAAPWTFRGSLKYRSIESRLFTTGDWRPSGAPGSHFEIAYCEFTDSVDGVFIGNVRAVSFHHNLVENISDDGVFVTAATDYSGETHGGGHEFLQNRFACCLTTFAFGVGHGRQKTTADHPDEKWGVRQLGGGLHIARNLFDFRRPVHYYWPTGPDAPQELSSLGRFAGDHGSPAWERMAILHNTLLTGDPPRYEYGTDGFSRAVGPGGRRIVLNNILCQMKGLPGQYLPDGRADFFADGNLLWSVSDGAATTALRQPRYPRDRVPPPQEWTAHDQFADPRFVALQADWRQPVDLRLRNDSPAVDRGVSIPAEFTRDDPLHGQDNGAPDIGALPLGVTPWRVGTYGRLDVCGREVTDAAPVALVWRQAEIPASDLRQTTGKPVAIVTGYPAFEAPLIAFACRKVGCDVVEFEKQWLPASEFAKYRAVIVDGSFTRGRVTPTKFADEELPLVQQYLEQGGTLLLFRERFDLFASDAGKRWLDERLGAQQRSADVNSQLLQPQHPWVRHLARSDADLSWMAKGSPYGFGPGENIVGTTSGKTILGRVAIGQGQILYVGWGLAASIPGGRAPATVADERRFEDQMQVLLAIAAEIQARE